MCQQLHAESRMQASVKHVQAWLAAFRGSHAVYMAQESYGNCAEGKPAYKSKHLFEADLRGSLKLDCEA